MGPGSHISQLNPIFISRAISLFYNSVHSLCLETLGSLATLCRLRGRGGSCSGGGVASGSAGTGNLESNAAAKGTSTVVVGD